MTRKIHFSEFSNSNKKAEDTSIVMVPVYESLNDALDVLNALLEIVEVYGMASVADLYDLSDISGYNPFLNKQGWTNLIDCKVIFKDGLWNLILPKTVSIVNI